MDVQAWIKKCESLRLLPYKDSLDHLTIGWGRNLEDGLSIDEAEYLFQNDYKHTVAELKQHDWYNIQPFLVQAALINMNFNLGIEKLLGFKKMIAALVNKDYTNAAREALDSKWADQVGQRAKDIAVMINQGNNEPQT